MSARHGQRGQALVEFAFAATIFIVLFFAILDYGRAFYTYDQVGQAARLGARWAIVNTVPPTSDCATAGGACQTKIVNYITSKSALAPSKLATTITFGGTPSSPTALTCASQPTPGCWVNINLQYTFTFVLLPLPSRTLTSSSQMVISTQYP
jgi:Flp pilus assembly protein TadG